MNWSRAFFGGIILLVGILFLLDNLDVIDAGRVISSWWPVVIVFGGLLSWAANRRHWIVPVILVGGGVLVLLRTTGVIDNVAFLWPALLIAVGLLLLFGRGLAQNTTAQDSVSSFNLFSGSDIASNSASFRGGQVGALFGGADLDLRQASLAEGAALDIFVAFGGVEVKVPEGWYVELNGFPVFGGLDNKTAGDQLPPDAPRLRIDATVLFGGVEVKN